MVPLMQQPHPPMARLRSARVGAAAALLCLLFPGCAAEGPPEPWFATWSSSMAEDAPGLQDQTLRQVVRISAGGAQVRVRLSHVFGTEATRVGAASVGIAQEGADIEPGTLRMLTFGGSPSVVLEPGEELASDPVELSVPAGADLAVSLYLEADSGDATRHRAAQQTAYIGDGDQTAADTFVVGSTSRSADWLTGVDVFAPETELVIVAFGDSITEGSGSTTDLHTRYPDVLARELAARGVAGAVANAGIGGNRLLNDGFSTFGAGPSGLSRFDRDVLAQPRVTHVLLLEGVNDIGMGGTLGPVVTAEEIIAGYETLIRRAHRRDVRVVIGTILPFRGAVFPRYWTAANEAKRQEVNAWIRTTNAHDGFVDFDAALLDPDDPEQMLLELHSGDFLHPSDAGYQLMGEAAADVFAP
jgi:lysophospholipase L1-like esterase